MIAGRGSTDGLRPLIVIGAARSGTKLLRSLLAAPEGMVEIPYDINYVWLTANLRSSDDAIGAEDVTPEYAEFVRSYFQSFAASERDTVVEKTVSNCFRIPVVDTVFPGAFYVHIIRDGRDVVASAQHQWRASPRAADLIPKLRTFPFRKAGPYAWAYFKSSTARMLRGDRTRSSWGPRYPGIDNDIAALELVEVCALQWATSVAAARRGLETIPEDRKIEVRYEELVRNPQNVVALVAAASGMFKPGDSDFGKVHGASVGRWSEDLDPDEQRQVLALISSQLTELGY